MALKGSELPVLIGVSKPYTKHEVTLMLHTTNPVIKHKAGLLNLAEELSNVSKACKIMGVSRDTFIVIENWPMKAAWMH